MSVHVQAHLHIHEWWHCPDPGHHRVRLFVRARPAELCRIFARKGQLSGNVGQNLTECYTVTPSARLNGTAATFESSSSYIKNLHHFSKCSLVHQPHNSQIYLIPLIHHQPWRLKTSLNIMIIGKNKGKVESECEQYCCPAHFQVSWGLA